MSSDKNGDEDKTKSLTTVSDDNKIELPHPDKCQISLHKTREELAKIPYTSKLTTHYKNPQNLVKVPYLKPYESTYVANRPIEEPIERAVDQLKAKPNRKTKYYIPGYRANYDFIIIGGGAMGCSVAYWIAQRFYKRYKILVIERDMKVF